MKKFIALVLCFVFVFSLGACDLDKSIVKDNNTTDTSTTYTEEPTTECTHDFEVKVYKEPSYGVSGYGEYKCKLCDYSTIDSIDALPDVFELEVLSKYEYMNGDEGVVCFDIEIENISDMEIESISGSLTVIAGGKILNIDCDFKALNLKAHDTTLLKDYGYAFEYNSAENEVDKKVYDTSFDDLKFLFEASEVNVK